MFSLYKDNQIDEIYKLLGDDIDAEDMRPTALALYAFLEYEKGNLKRAKQYYERAKKIISKRKNLNDNSDSSGSSILIKKSF